MMGPRGDGAAEVQTPNGDSKLLGARHFQRDWVVGRPGVLK
jgi:hypothetical protein